MTLYELAMEWPCPTCGALTGKDCLPVGPYPNRSKIVCVPRIENVEITIGDDNGDSDGF